MKKLNCWEFMKCGREIGGINVAEAGVCPVVVETKANGIHGGINAGRCCWVVAGNLCEGTGKGAFVDNFQSCVQCPFYGLVTREEKDYLTGNEIRKYLS
ncbi:MAG: hypothetical protein Q7S42_00500 [Candidatus Omnitrophota bacterium]|nr:hypothetical protein [Candidatus Omnitrophota bacterium]